MRSPLNGFLRGSGNAWPEEFIRETRELMLRRARVAIIVGASITVAVMAIDAWRIAPERYLQAVLVRVTAAALLLLLLAATRARNAVRWSEWIGGGAFVILMASTAAIMPLFDGPADPHYATQGTGIVLCILGAGILLPIDALRMLLLGLIATALHVGFTLDFAPAHNLPILGATVSSVVVATAGAREFTRSRLAEFAGRRAKENFVAMLTHDIKNPLAVIDGFVQMLREDSEMTPQARADLLAHVQRAVRNAITLAVDFLDASKIEADRFVLKTRMTDIGEVLQRAVSDQRPNAAQKGISLVNATTADLPAVNADGTALDRVFANLLGNAIKHTQGGGTVRVVAHLSALDELEILVEDTGEGIPPGEESHIFDRYTRAASRADSTGLGLFIARTITAGHGGTVSAENRQDCRGARFRVTLPVAVSAPAGVARRSG
jgi:signal transduction histidine kinase